MGLPGGPPLPFDARLLFEDPQDFARPAWAALERASLYRRVDPVYERWLECREDALHPFAVPELADIDRKNVADALATYERRKEFDEIFDLYY